MTKTEIFLKKSNLYPALILEGFFSSKKRGRIIKTTKYLLYAIPVIIILSIIFSSYTSADPNGSNNFLIIKMIGLAMILGGIYLMMETFEAYFAARYYFEHVSKNKYETEEKYTFSAGRILRRVENDNLLTGLLKSQSIGLKIVDRLGISREESDLLLLKQAELKNPPFFDTNDIPLVRVSAVYAV